MIKWRIQIGEVPPQWFWDAVQRGLIDIPPAATNLWGRDGVTLNGVTVQVGEKLYRDAIHWPEPQP